MFRLDVLPQQPPLGASPFLGRFRGRKRLRALPHLTNCFQGLALRSVQRTISFWNPSRFLICIAGLLMKINK
jgi:hypothetical protein